MTTNERDGSCRQWSDHDWSERRFVEAGRHPTMGRFQRFLVTCTRCKKTTTQTDWITLTDELKFQRQGAAE